jgi:hypothetical protein
MSETQTSEESADEINEQALLKNPDSQPNTQPLNSEDERQSPLLANLKEPWGFLLPSNELFDSVALIKVNSNKRRLFKQGLQIGYLST